MAVLLSVLFRWGMPVLVVLAFLRFFPWWLVLVPVIPVWWSFIASVGEARKRARIIKRPNRGMSLEESAAEQQFLRADAVLIEADAGRAGAFEELAAARNAGVVRQRRRTQVERSGNWGGPPA